MSPLEILDQLYSLSNRMLPLAEQQDIDGLVAMEAKRAALIALFPGQWVVTSSEAVQLKQQIEVILAANVKMMDLLGPWHEQMEVLLSKLKPLSTSS